ncbi:MAG: glycosyltransferase family 39 protein [Verrucomicrobiota bacterium]
MISIPRFSKTKYSLLLAVFAASALILARLHCASVYRVDSDEPQHLHVVWGVANGLVQYRDIFDNHSPLFHLLCAPIFRALGDQAEILTRMRLAMIPLYLGCIGCVYGIGATLFSRRCGILAAVLAAFAPRFFCTSIEFRPDTLWALAWLLSLAALTCARRPVARWFAGGLLLGAAFSLSMKSTLMALDLAGAGAFTWLVCRKNLGRPGLLRGARAAALFLGGLAVVPSLLLLRFASLNALGALGYCLIRHNLIAAAERTRPAGLRELAVLGAFGLLLWWSRRMFRSTPDPALGARRVFLLLACGLYPVLLFVFWPLVTREDFLPLLPAICLGVVPVLLEILDPLASRISRPGWITAAVAACLVAAEIHADISAIRPWQNRTGLQARFIAQTLRLTDPGDYVMDAKGETIYRKRPYYYVLEEMTRWKFKRGQLADDIPERMISQRVCVATKCYQRYPLRTAGFLKANFVPVGYRLLVAGKILRPDRSGKAIGFSLAIPSEYALAWRSGQGEALLDGCPYTAPVRLEAGPHTLQILRGSGPVAIVWARAIQRGFHPFYLPSKEEKRELGQAIRDNIL